MKILMLTNTYLPHVGGVARSVSTFRDEYRRRGHRVVVAPQYDTPGPDENDVIRMPAIRHFNGSEFSMEVPVPGLLRSALAGFEPDIVHSHHPFLLGDSALRVARWKGVPLVYTFHTMWEHYAHYVWGESPWLKKFVSALAIGYAGLADRVFAPSGSVARYLRENGVRTRVSVVPTGIDLSAWRSGEGLRFRSAEGIPANAFVAGYLGRLAVEKNLEFLGRAVCRFLQKHPGAFFVVVGEGPRKRSLRAILEAAGLKGRIRCVGALSGPALWDAVAAMDVLALSSKSETQGLVLAEAMAAGVPVVALDAPGSRDIVQDGVNGRLVREENIAAFAGAIEWVFSLDHAERNALWERCVATAGHYSIGTVAARVLRIYEDCIKENRMRRRHARGTLSELRAEWSLLQNLAAAAGAST